MLIATKGRPRRLPDFLVVGAAKSGTTSIYFYLRQHPDIFMSEQIKEPGFFCFAGRERPVMPPGHPYSDLWRSAIINPDAYSALFDDAGEHQSIGDATPEYLYLHADTIGNIRRYYGTHASELKIIAVLRNPVERLWSHYWMYLRDGYESLPTEQAASPEVVCQRLRDGWHPSYDYLGFGCYAEQISAYIQAFGKDRVHVILFEELGRDAGAVCRDIYRFLGVSADFVGNTGTTYNVSGKLRHPWLHDLLFIRQHLFKSLGRRIVPYDRLQWLKHKLVAWNTDKQKMPEGLRRRLIAYYRDDILEVAEILGKDLHSWLI